MNYKIIAYAQDFASFLLEKLGEDAENVNKIILFGSAAKGEASEKSDIDIFVETDRDIEEEVNKLKEKFYKSIKATKYWNLLGIKNEINLSIGRLEEWGELKESIIADGIVLFGKYETEQEKKHFYLFVISHGENRNKNISLWRNLYGYKQKIGKKEYTKSGLIKEYKGEKLARGVFKIPIENANKMILFLKKQKVQYKIIPFWS